MPTYEFRCPDGHEFEKFYRTISGAESQALCPVCQKPAERIMSAAGFAFKGSGFYLTDYGKNAHREKGTPEVKSGESSGGDSGGESSKSENAPSESKSNAKSESKSDAPKSEAKSSDTSTSGGDSKKAEKKADPKAESKPASAPPKPGKSE